MHPRKPLTHSWPIMVSYHKMYEEDGDKVLGYKAIVCANVHKIGECFGATMPECGHYVNILLAEKGLEGVI